MRTSIFCLCLLLSGVSCATEPNQIDALLSASNRVYNSNPDSSFQLALQAEKLAIRQDLKPQLGYAILGQARYHLLKSNLELSAEKINQAAEIFHKLNMDAGIAKVYALQSTLSGRIGKPEEDIKYLEKALSIYRRLQDTTGITSTLSNLSYLYSEAGKFAISRKSLIELERILDGEVGKNSYYLIQNWGSFYSCQSQYRKAIDYYLKAMKLADDLNMIDSRATINLIVGLAYQKVDEYNKAEHHMLTSLSIAQENNLVYETLEAYEGLKGVYEQQKNIEKAYIVFKNIIAIKDTIYNLETVNRLNDYDKKLALAEKEKIISAQEFSMKQEQLKSEAEKSKNQILLLIIFVVVLISGVAIFAFIKTKRLKDEVSIQKDEAENQREYLEEAYKNITDSIQYAKRIQQAVLKSEEHQSKHLPEHFIMFEPKDIVSGDFYWAQEMGDDLYMAVADCTGHGVPGAFMSMLGIAFLNDIFSDYSGLSPAQTLDELRNRIISELGQTGKEGENRDGMDISLIRLNLKTNHLEWSGANNSLYLLRQSDAISEPDIKEMKHTAHDGLILSEIKPDKQPIGYYDYMNPFTNHSVQLDKGDVIYLFSDGYADQFGGLKGKKLKYKPFKELIIQNFSESMDMQKLLLNKYFKNWKGEHEQVDDVCVLGVRV
ncbi:MAG: SpoIIE family protein phosphatase [Flavobacteriales bacterium]|nr:SpoIIE family protein phosphatase [Flavobacteriales bacterium]